jgi:hypothetical protein
VAANGCAYKHVLCQSGCSGRKLVLDLLLLAYRVPLENFVGELAAWLVIGGKIEFREIDTITEEGDLFLLWPPARAQES